MTDEARNLIRHVADAVEKSTTEWHCESGINRDTVAESVRREVEAHFRQCGFEVRREMRLSDGKRLRGLWLRFKGYR